tara:strand:- start:2179 stop:3459 length:1281 start_codon:yes stop_codon:yes gene_type:complete
MEEVEDCALRVMDVLGTGRREAVYQAALRVELQMKGQFLDSEVSHPITYRGYHVGMQRLDLEGPEYFIELKASTRILPSHIAQAAAYARDRQKPGVVINFGPYFGIQFVDRGVGTPPIDVHKIMTTTFPMTRNPMLTTEVKIKIVKDRYGEEIVAKPKIGIDAGDKFYNIYRGATALRVMWSTVGEGGDQVTFNKAEKDARTSFTLMRGAPDRVQKVLPNLLEEQNKTFETLHKEFEDLVLAAYDSEEVECKFKTKFKKAAKKKLKGATPEEQDALARKMYLENATNCMIKTRDYKDENGEEREVECLNARRRAYTTRDGELTPADLNFHKIDHTGDYHLVEYGDYVPKGTLLKVRLRPQFFTAPLMYGVSCWFDKDIIVLWRPKRVEAKKESALVPVFDDGDDEPTGKRARDDDDAPDAKRARSD